MICWLTINRECNMRCGWCYASADGFKAVRMSMDTFSLIKDSVSRQKISRFILLGGEPTLHPQLQEMIKALKPTRVVLVTNAVKLADKTYLEGLAECGLDIVTISLKGSTEKEYKENTGRSCLNSVERAVSNLNDLGLDYSISVTFSESIMTSIPSVILWMKSANAQSMSINYCRPVIVGDNASIAGIPHPHEMARHTIDSYELIKASGVKCIYNFMLPLCLLPLDFINELIRNELLTTVCQLQKNNGLIFMPDGTLIPCNHLYDYSLGKAGEDFTGPEEFDVFRKSESVKNFYQKTSGLPDGRCMDCGLRERCGGGCFIQYLHYAAAEIIGQPFERRCLL